MTIAVDFDGTIVEDRYPEIGEERPFATDTLKMLIKERHRIILWTVREGQALEEAIEWCRQRGVEFYAVNRDYPEETFENNQHFSRKLKVDRFIDDRNIGGLPDWGTIYRMVSHYKTWDDVIAQEVSSATLTPPDDSRRRRRRSWWRRIFGAFLIGLLLTAPVEMAAQTRRVVKKPRQPVVVENPRFVEMLASVAQVMIADSLLTDSATALSRIHQNAEQGRLTTYSQLTGKPVQGLAFVNEIGDFCIFSQTGADGHSRLFQATRDGRDWAKAQPLQGIDPDGVFTDVDYPFLMPDGATLYFSARGGAGLGGYDIYRTRFDAEQQRFLRPENMGLPFNSESDDYFFVIDEVNSIGMFASSRHHRRDTVCLYTFLPFESRHIINVDDVGESRLRSLARIDRIADTWGDGNERKAILQRLAAAKHHSDANVQEPETAEAFRFVVDDETVYTSLEQFRKARSRAMMKDLVTLYQQVSNLSEKLELWRKAYFKAPSQQQEQLRPTILSTEEKVFALESEISFMEKQIRNLEAE